MNRWKKLSPPVQYGLILFLTLGSALFFALLMTESAPAPIALLAAITLAGAALVGLDKRAAIHGGMRIPERVFFLVALAGGSAGILAAMPLFRHKTRKPQFSLVITVVLLLQIAAYAWV